MVMCLEHQKEIENLSNHPQETVISFRNLLEDGAEAIPDPKRPGFYEVHSADQAYYFNVSPITGKILLLAAWQNRAVNA
jgi:hypothetical protein